jgi:hypothetical protein
VIIFLNGPPHSGKDTVAGIIKKLLPNCGEYKMSKPLKDAFKSIFPFPPEFSAKLLEEYKDEPFYNGIDITPRQFQINLSEELIRPMFGKDVFGNIACMSLRQMPYKHIVISDSGFEEEIKPIFKMFGPQRTLGIVISRTGCDYDNDSRSDLDFHSLGITWDLLDNKYDLELLEEQVKRILRSHGVLEDND